MEKLYEGLKKEASDLLAWTPNRTEKQEYVNGKEEEYFIEWTQLDNSDEKQILMTLRLALFDDEIAITTWQQNENGTEERRSVSVTSIEEGKAIINYFTNITCNRWCLN